MLEFNQRIVWLPVFNSTNETIPGCALMEPFADPTGSPAHNGQHEDGSWFVRKPTKDSDPRVIVNSEAEIPPGQYGQGHRSTMAVLLYDTAETLPLAGDNFGSAAGTWFVKKDKTGFIIDHAGNGRANAQRSAVGGGGSRAYFATFGPTFVWNGTPPGGYTNEAGRFVFGGVYSTTTIGGMIINNGEKITGFLTSSFRTDNDATLCIPVDKTEIQCWTGLYAAGSPSTLIARNGPYFNGIGDPGTGSSWFESAGFYLGPNLSGIPFTITLPFSFTGSVGQDALWFKVGNVGPTTKRAYSQLLYMIG